MNSQASRKLNTFLLLLVLSLVGNACADFAMVWHGVAKAGESKSFLSSFYIGQALGIVLVAPLVSAFIDRLPRRSAGVLLDFGYALILVALVILNSLGMLSSVLILPISIFTAAFGAVHRSAIGFGALKELSEELGVNTIVAKYQASLYLTNMIGAAVSGYITLKLGLNGCLALATATFIPMPFVYFWIFRSKPKPTLQIKGLSITSYMAGWKFIFQRPALRWFAISLSVVNFASNIFPGLVALSFARRYPDQVNLASYAVAVSIFFGVLSFKKAIPLSQTINLNKIVPYAFALPILLLAISAFVPNPYLFTLAFAAQCAAAALVNVVSGSLRIKLISSENLAQVNTSFQALLYCGQVIGSLILIPLMEKSQIYGSLGVLIAFSTASVIAFYFLPRRKMNEEVGN